uniref:Peptidase A1 domain-containing protein n=1 Tax=Leersia perrieri TaxID=77586 RepID=A0A0D9XEZ1_9ORYZ
MTLTIDASVGGATSNSSALTIVHLHGPCSPLHSPHAGAPPPPSHAEILERDQSRANSIHRKTSTTSPDPTPTSKQAAASLPAHTGISLGTLNYVVTVGLGTPSRPYTVVFDTGSDLSWVQCSPCRAAGGCYEQQDPLFDPSQSSTYAAVACSEADCDLLDADTGSCSTDGDSRCRYKVLYGDDSNTYGDLARDTLTLSGNDKLYGFVFGCGEENSGLFGHADGLLGLGRESVSLPSQGAAIGYGPGFTYCLPSSSANGYLSLGAASSPAANAVFTPMVTRMDTPSFYYLDLIGIKVARRPLNFPATTFAVSGGGTVIDSGTVITRLPRRAYEALRSAFVREMVNRNYRRAPALSILDTCYDLTTGHGGKAGAAAAAADVPRVELDFAGGASVVLDAAGVLYVAKATQACLAFASTGDDTSIAILGNTQQKTFAVVYDVANKRIGFAPKACS